MEVFDAMDGPLDDDDLFLADDDDLEPLELSDDDLGDEDDELA
jgi:hypothetical protein